MMWRWTICMGWLCAMLLHVGCDAPSANPAEQNRREMLDQQLQAKWGKTLDELPAVSLKIITPNNNNIKAEYERAFVAHYAITYGKRVEIQWPSVGGGGSQILQYLENIFSQTSQGDGPDTAELDLIWGGGPYAFSKLANSKYQPLIPLKLPNDILDAIPAQLGGVRLRDKKMRWIGTSLSGFGILVNKTLLTRLGLTEPQSWDDLGKSCYHDLIALADPSKSGSANASFEMVVQSGDNWPDGWAKLHQMLGNATQFYAGASLSANAVICEAPIATCIDFYGFMRVAKYPDDLQYISPDGQTAFTPDPIGMLKNPPNRVVAQRFVEFLLSRKGQALWALRCGQPDGPTAAALGRQPIRPDVYEHHQGKFSPWIVNPFLSGKAMNLDTKMSGLRYNVLRTLVSAGPVMNLSLLRAAKAKLIASGDSKLQTQFDALPPNLQTEADIKTISKQLRKPEQKEMIRDGWEEFFRKKYEAILVD